MTPPNVAYSAALLLAGVFCLLVGLIIGQQRRHALGGRALMALMFAMAWWDITYALFWAGLPGPTPWFWLDMTYVGVLASPVAMFVFTLQFVSWGRWLRPPLLMGLVGISGLMLIALFTDPWHHLFTGPDRSPDAGMILDGGPLFWANAIYSYLLVLLSMLLIALRVRRSSGLFRRQLVLILAAIGLPLLNSVIFILGYSPLPNADNTPFVFSVTALILAYAILRFQLLDVTPIARHMLVEIMSDGLLVLDSRNRVVDMNPVAQRELEIASLGRVIGRPVTEALADWPRLLGRFHGLTQERTEFVTGDNPPRYLDVRISPLMDERSQEVGRLVIWRDVSALRLAQIELEKLAITDELTGLYNRRYLLRMAEQERYRAIRADRPLSLLIIDIDHFKQINDRYGHPVGDEALRQFAQICQQNIRQIDLLGRFGGEEFILLLPETNREQAQQAAERLRRLVEEASVETEDFSFGLTISLGITSLTDEEESIDTLLLRADQALYAAKQHGRNQVACG